MIGTVLKLILAITNCSMHEKNSKLHGGVDLQYHITHFIHVREVFSTIQLIGQLL